ncbi:hypothetical protein CISIN_1g033258mg [Citrus sinensis]|nr:hypothetical protein CISIN_1g033258mg [Citrus sinensis]
MDLSTFDPNDVVFDERCRANETYFYAWLVNKRGKGMVQRVVTKRGYWEADGVDVPVYSDREMKVMVGFKKNWTFYLGTEPEGQKSAWSMTEYRVNPRLIPADQMNDDVKTRIVSYAVCKITKA